MKYNHDSRRRRATVQRKSRPKSTKYSALTSTDWRVPDGVAGKFTDETKRHNNGSGSEVVV